MTADLTRRTLVGAGLASLALSKASIPRAMAASAMTQAEPAASIVLGALFPFSGAQALAGDEAWRGVALAVRAARGAGMAPVRLIRADAADPARAVDIFAKSGAKSGPVTAILGTASSTASFAATAAAELAKIPYAELDAPADAITARGFKMLIRTGLTTADLAASASAAIAGVIAPGWHRAADTLRIGLLFDVGAADGSFAAAMIAACKAAKLPILLTMGYATDAMDLAAEVDRMKRARIDLLVHAGRPAHVLLLYEAMDVASWRPRMIIGAGSGYGLSETGFALGPAIGNTMAVGCPLYASGGASAAIAAAYRRRYATQPRGAASLTAYVGAALVLQALRGGKTLPGALAAIDAPRGMLANGWGAAFDASGQNRRSFATLQQWRGGALVTIDPAVKGAAKPVLEL
ncbi:ABC transporter substrate-binding protein [Acidiphilium iwatense]|uniref:ABC transporter substrate-binding protein n=1 Tax=Acidiphilium iwatense TaxID=768198 RepID=A0ABS9E3G4_9PROT|nr:ABC transporter substrate-binding protein [Acidiphilium iwatense]MCF3948461.1 ABC transporter substrate-binding protein [Acidiphilium iwatense]